MDAVTECDFMFPGHTHCRMQRAVNGCRIVNSGSLGMPRDGKGRSYCLVDFSTGEVAHQSLEI
jgi:predicted phosphodiesterase